MSALPTIATPPALEPSEAELRALRLFVSPDETRPHYATLWRYESDGGLTYAATDGHTLVVRRSGTHRAMKLADVERLTVRGAWGVGSVGVASAPPRWASVCHPNPAHKLAPAYSVNPAYFARLGDVERAAGRRAADDFRPPPGMSKKDAAKKRAYLRDGSCTRLVIPSELDGWHWSLETDAAAWEGVLMPRRP